jgi:hypothetical protein
MHTNVHIIYLSRNNNWRVRLLHETVVMIVNNAFNQEILQHKLHRILFICIIKK